MARKEVCAVTQYRCYFITSANRAEDSLVIDASSPQAAADEAAIRCTNPTFVSLEVWDGTACILTRRLARPWPPSATRSPSAHIGDA